MKKIEINDKWMQKTSVVWFGAMLCCLLWGSAFPCIKIGYGLWNIESADTSAQILFAGMAPIKYSLDCPALNSVANAPGKISVIAIPRIINTIV